MKKLSSIVLSLAMLAGVSGCTTTQQGATAGVVGGALVGQAIGHSTEATLIGAAVGGVTGALIGESMKNKGYCRYKDPNGTIYEAKCPS